MGSRAMCIQLYLCRWGPQGRSPGKVSDHRGLVRQLLVLFRHAVDEAGGSTAMSWSRA